MAIVVSAEATRERSPADLVSGHPSPTSAAIINPAGEMAAVTACVVRHLKAGSDARQDQPPSFDQAPPPSARCLSCSDLDVRTADATLSHARDLTRSDRSLCDHHSARRRLDMARLLLLWLGLRPTPNGYPGMRGNS